MVDDLDVPKVFGYVGHDFPAAANVVKIGTRGHEAIGNWKGLRGVDGGARGIRDHVEAKEHVGKTEPSEMREHVGMRGYAGI